VNGKRGPIQETSRKVGNTRSQSRAKGGSAPKAEICRLPRKRRKGAETGRKERNRRKKSGESVREKGNFPASVGKNLWTGTHERKITKTRTGLRPAPLARSSPKACCRENWRRNGRERGRREYSLPSRLGGSLGTHLEGNVCVRLQSGEPKVLQVTVTNCSNHRYLGKKRQLGTKKKNEALARGRKVKWGFA